MKKKKEKKSESESCFLTAQGLVMRKWEASQGGVSFGVLNSFCARAI